MIEPTDSFSKCVSLAAYRSSGIEANLIVVGWDSLSTPKSPGGFLHSLDFVTGYFLVIPNIPIAAARVADFISWLVEINALSLSQTHLIGHSLGAHVAGETGKFIQAKLWQSGEKVARITGLDPAGSC